MRIRFGNDLRTERRISGVPRDVNGALLAAAEAHCTASVMERLCLDLECADATGMESAVRIIEHNCASLRRLAVSVGEKQFGDTTAVSSLRDNLGRLRLEQLTARIVFNGMKAPGASGFLASVLNVDTPHVIVGFEIELNFTCKVFCTARRHTQRCQSTTDRTST